MPDGEDQRRIWGMDKDIKKYQIIYADPPWKFSGYVRENKNGISRPQIPYQMMTDREIMCLPVKNIIDDDAILFMWVVDSRMGIMKDIFSSWGFTYKTVGFVWNKVAKTTNGVNATYSKYTRKS